MTDDSLWQAREEALDEYSRAQQFLDDATYAFKYEDDVEGARVLIYNGALRRLKAAAQAFDLADDMWRDGSPSVLRLQQIKAEHLERKRLEQR